MLDIKFIPKKGDLLRTNDTDNRTYRLSVNGINDMLSLTVSNDFPILYSNFYAIHVIEILESLEIQSLKSYFNQFSIIKKYDWWKGEIDFRIYCDESDIPPNRSDCFEIEISLKVRIFEWAKLWSFTDFVESFRQNMPLIQSEMMPGWEMYGEDDFYKVSSVYDSGMRMSCFVKRDSGNSFGFHINEQSELIRRGIELTNIKLLERVNPNSVFVYFDFPVLIRNACNQYLIYFTQFIADMGIDVNSEIIEEPNQTLFKVTPKDKGEALSKIREALDIYLTLPTNQDFESQAERFPDLAVMQLSKKIHDLKGDFKIAEMQMKMQESMIQLKDATIQLKDATIGTLELRVLELSQYQQKSSDEKKELEKEEDLIKGIVSVKKFEAKGVSVNLGELLRMLKRKFNK
ncbi:MAG: hypothetical protein JWO03_462 [Bacteroidetes bacterium]|nr:hypothetical protein [Bacteroidota bacterium]